MDGVTIILPTGEHVAADRFSQSANAVTVHLPCGCAVRFSRAAIDDAATEMARAVWNERNTDVIPAASLIRHEYATATDGE